MALWYGSFKVQIDDMIGNAASAGHLKVIKALVPLNDNLKTHCNHRYCSNNCYPDHVRKYFMSIKQTQ